MKALVLRRFKIIGYFLFVFIPAFSFDGLSQFRKGQKKILLGADLSSVNEMEDCGGKWKLEGKETDPFQIFAQQGCAIVRVRLLHSPDWTIYSTLPDVCKTIQRAKARKMKVLLDFHYSDKWADPGHQSIPKAWSKITNKVQLGDTVFEYTYQTLLKLDDLNLMPDIVQVGNEINTEVLQYQEKISTSKINWKRNASLLNRGLDAVRYASKKTGKKVETMIHISQPEEAQDWFQQAVKHNLRKFDWMGLSYYPQWSKFDVFQLKDEVKKLKNRFRKKIMIVETGYPFTLVNADSARNLLDSTSYRVGFPISKSGQKQFMVTLAKSVSEAGGEGVLYWEPAWISTPCKTNWGVGSNFDNAIFFDPKNENEALPVFDFFKSL